MRRNLATLSEAIHRLSKGAKYVWFEHPKTGKLIRLTRRNVARFSKPDVVGHTKPKERR